MKTRHRKQQESAPLSPLNRTRLMLGVVMIPLAASCIFASGAYSQRLVTESAPHRGVVEVRAIYSERRGSEAEQLAEAGSEENRQSHRLHFAGGPQAALPARNHHADACFPEFSAALDAPQTRPRHIVNSLPLLRGPPHAA